MGSGAYYNEIEPYAAQWLRNLIAAGEIADGEVDERSIEEITPSELRGFNQCHFFAGIGIWSLALRRSGWHDTRSVWTGSCPCQPFSTAGKGSGFDDERHLWPHWFYLIEECSPEVVMGEQVASKDGLGWLDLVSSDMEATNHTFWAVDTCAAGFGAPHWRQRLYWVAYAYGNRQKRQRELVEPKHTTQNCDRCSILWLADANGDGCQTGCDATAPLGQRGATDANGRLPSATSPALPTNGFWRCADWLWGRDGYFRPVEPGTSPLADGDPAHVGQISAYGNAICAEQAQGFIESVM